MTYNIKSRNYKKLHKPLSVVEYNNELLLIVEDRVFATIYLETMENEDSKPTDNFWIAFRSFGNGGIEIDKNYSSVFVKKGEV